MSTAELTWNPNVNPPPHALCQGCDQPLWRAGDNWADGRGILVCIKAQIEDTGHGETPDYVFHQPMPDGLRGAPLPR